MLIIISRSTYRPFGLIDDRRAEQIPNHADLAELALTEVKRHCLGKRLVVVFWGNTCNWFSWQLALCGIHTVLAVSFIWLVIIELIFIESTLLTFLILSSWILILGRFHLILLIVSRFFIIWTIFLRTALRKYLKAFTELCGQAFSRWGHTFVSALLTGSDIAQSTAWYSRPFKLYDLSTWTVTFWIIILFRCCIASDIVFLKVWLVEKFCEILVIKHNLLWGSWYLVIVMRAWLSPSIFLVIRC